MMSPYAPNGDPKMHEGYAVLSVIGRPFAGPMGEVRFSFRRDGEAEIERHLVASRIHNTRALDPSAGGENGVAVPQQAIRERIYTNNV